jgi:CHAT domain-containing protein
VRVCCPKYANPDYELPETALEEKFLVDTFQATPVRATESEVRNLLKAGGQLDLFHFGGHGRAETNDIANAEILLAGRREGGVYIDASVTPNLVQQHARLGTADGLGPLVVLNACQVGRLGTQMSSLGGFAEAFLSRGAAAFVSSLWSVGDAPARTFVETFYTSLLANKTATQAAVAARKAARAAGDATWLAYVVYAHPAAKLI